MISAESVSIILQKRLEKQLAGFGLCHPCLALEMFKRVESIMVDDWAIYYLRNLSNYEHELQRLNDYGRIVRAVSVAFSNSASTAWLLEGLAGTAPGVYNDHSTVEEIISDHSTIVDIADDLVRRIKLQKILRQALGEIQNFVKDNRYIEHGR
jgi:hypothetical protein